MCGAWRRLSLQEGVTRAPWYAPGMNSPEKPPSGSTPKDGSDAPSKADGLAIGIGCLVTFLLLGAAALFAYVRN